MSVKHTVFFRKDTDKEQKVQHFETLDEFVAFCLRMHLQHKVVQEHTFYTIVYTERDHGNL